MSTIPRTRRARRTSASPERPYGDAVISPGRRTSRPIVAGRITATIVAGLTAGFLLAGCAPPATPDPSTSPEPQLLPSTSTAPPDEPVSAEVELPWPAATAADAGALQAQVDRGSQPWLLDPSEVAIAYAAAAHDWPDAEAYPGPDGTSVDVRNADGERITLSLTQPIRTGNDGIWVVTAEHR